MPIPHPLLAELEFVRQILKKRNPNAHHQIGGGTAENSEVIPPKHDPNTIIGHLIAENHLDFNERLLLSLALSIHISPAILQTYSGAGKLAMVDFGTTEGRIFKGAVPTGLTWVYLAAGSDPQARLEVIASIASNYLLKHSLILIEPCRGAEPFLSGPLCVDQDFLYQLLSNAKREIPTHAI